MAEDLKEAETWQKIEQWYRALQALERAKVRMVGSGSGILQTQVGERLREIAFVVRLEEAQLRASTNALVDKLDNVGFNDQIFLNRDFKRNSQNLNLDYLAADRAYFAAFAEHGWNVEAFPPDEIAKLIRASSCRTKLVAALDFWAFFKDRIPGGKAESLRSIAQLADDDPWRKQLRDPKLTQDRQTLERLAEMKDILAQPPANLLFLSYLLDKAKVRPAALLLLRRAQEKYPADFWINFELALLLYGDQSKIRIVEAVGFFRTAFALQPQSSPVANNLKNAMKKMNAEEEGLRQAVALNANDAGAQERLGAFLGGQGRNEEAEMAFMMLTQLRPNDGTAFQKLGWTLFAQGKPSEAETAFRQTLEKGHKTANVYFGLGWALEAQQKLSEATNSYRRAFELDRKNVQNCWRLAMVLYKLQRLPEAEALYRHAIQIDPGNSRGYHQLGNVLYLQKKYTQAITASNKAIELKPDYANAYNSLSVFLRAKGQLTESVKAQGKAIEINYSVAEANLGYLLMGEGRFAEALTAFKHSRELNSSDVITSEEHWAENWMQLDAKLAKILEGEIQPANSGECFALAEHCQLYCRQCYAASSRFYSEAFAADPNSVGDLRNGMRFDAARAAAQAGCGQGKDADNLDVKVFADLRGKALDWLRADLNAWGSEMAKVPAGVKIGVRYEMKRWQQDTALNRVRGEEALAKLPEAERREWQALWDDVAALEQRAK